MILFSRHSKEVDWMFQKLRPTIFGNSLLNYSSVSNGNLLYPLISLVESKVYWHFSLNHDSFDSYLKVGVVLFRLRHHRIEDCILFVVKLAWSVAFHLVQLFPNWIRTDYSMADLIKLLHTLFLTYLLKKRLSIYQNHTTENRLLHRNFFEC